MLVGFDTSDDAGVYRLNDEQALVFTADFITPPVDDPLIYGQIAAANSLSDIYAMGGKPLTCLNLVGFPSGKLENKVLEEIKELKSEENNNDSKRIEDEFGDVLFALVNYSRFINVNPEDALEKTNKRFIKRFQFLEKQITNDGKNANNENCKT